MKSTTYKAVMLAPLLLTACAISPNFGEANLADFNKDFGRTNPLNPTYHLEPISSNTYSLTMHQGGMFIGDGNTRWALLKQAADVIMASYCDRIQGKPSPSDWSKLGESGWVHLKVNFNCGAAGSTAPAQKPQGKEVLI